MSSCFSSLNHAQSGHWLMRPWLLYAQSFHQPAILLWCQSLDFVLRSWPLKAALLQPFVQQQKSVSFPVQCLQPVPFPSAEQKHHPLKRVHLILALHDAGKSIYPSPQIRVSAGNIHRIAAVEIVQHDCIAWIIARIVAASAPEHSSISTLPAWITAALPLAVGTAEYTGTSAKHTSAFSDTA